MEDIIVKLQQKDRKFKVTVKKKFIEDALYNSTSIRVASVYVIVVNREKTYDPVTNKQMKHHKKILSEMHKSNEDSSDEEEINNQIKMHDPIRHGRDLRKSANPHLMASKKASMYDSDTNHGPNANITEGDSNNTNTNNNNNNGGLQFKKLLNN